MNTDIKKYMPDPKKWIKVEKELINNIDIELCANVIYKDPKNGHIVKSDIWDCIQRKELKDQMYAVRHNGFDITKNEDITLMYDEFTEQYSELITTKDILYVSKISVIYHFD